MEIELQDSHGNTLDIFEISDELFYSLEKIADQEGIPVEDLIHKIILEHLHRMLDNEQDET